ncbi:MAG TPA: NAD(P)H-dependent oxidoreductase [bacterium]|nr:NAD(P)H-dependent oxidoreductase [bacterium]
MPEPFSVVAFTGSLRAASYNRALARAVRDLAPRSLAVRIEEIDAIPLYNLDVERAAFPDAVTRLKQAIGAADGTLIVTPEHNFSMSGVLKNVIDWISRPPGDAALRGKPVGILGATTGLVGTARAQMHLRTVLTNLNAIVMPQPAVLIPRANEKFDAAGRLTDEETARHIRTFLGAFTDWIALISRKERPDG